MWKLAKSQNGQCVVLVLCGRLGQEQLTELQRTIDSEIGTQPVALDLEGLKLVDQAMVHYIALCEKRGIRLDKCPAYIREWIASGNYGLEGE
jgi:ABC-type transporter Mla MlaB component